MGSTYKLEILCFINPFSHWNLDFQGAAVAYVADLLKVPAIFVKAVTDIVDGEKPTAEEFLQNLVAVLLHLINLSLKFLISSTENASLNFDACCPQFIMNQIWLAGVHL